ncbi:MAG: protein of unknown function containing DUF4339 domain/Sel1 repeat [Rhodobacteraceae bacterium HLUCCA08]|nr:MAG: protein of unknown function containing DUF4339 domain/Sel1 repeat [Rhodobacteraceae bacterium HLUCCA08]
MIRLPLKPLSLCLALGLSGAALAQSSQSVTIGDRTITLLSQGASTISPSADGGVFEGGGHRVEVAGDTLSVNGNPVPIGGATEIVIDTVNGLTLTIDGAVLMAEAAAMPAGDSIAALTARAEAGDVEAMNDLAVAYATGDGVAQDTDRAIALYTEAAEAGQPVAADNLAWILITGQYGPADVAAGMRWARIGAEADQPRSLRYLGLGHLYGDGGLAQDFDLAKDYLERAATADDGFAAFMLGQAMVEGAVEGGREEGMIWLEIAAERGEQDAADYLAALDGDAAIEWFYADGQMPVGPLTLQDIRAALAQDGRGPDTLVWATGAEDWRPARDWPELVPDGTD